MWISKQEYDESGPSIVHRKCVVILYLGILAAFGMLICALSGVFKRRKIRTSPVASSGFLEGRYLNSAARECVDERGSFFSSAMKGRDTEVQNGGSIMERRKRRHTKAFQFFCSFFHTNHIRVFVLR